MATALSIVQKLFPEVKEVVDAGRNSVIEVTKRDTSSATVKNHKACAMAVACKRKFDLDGVIISVNTAYLVKGNKATRFKVPESVSREIVAFDRKGEFVPGEYRLIPPPEASKLGSRTGSNRDSRTGNGHAKRYRHKTEGIRAALGTKEAV